MARNLADSLIIPFNVSDYTVTLNQMKTTLFKDFGTLMQQNKINTGKPNGHLTFRQLRINVEQRHGFL